jgi:hypothetical protein
MYLGMRCSLMQYLCRRQRCNALSVVHRSFRRPGPLGNPAPVGGLRDWNRLSPWLAWRPMIMVTTGKYNNPNKSPGIVHTKHFIPCYTTSEAPKLRAQTIDSSIGTVRVPHRTSVQRQSWHFELLLGPRDSRGASLCWCCPPGPAQLSPVAASTDRLPRAQRRPPWAHCQIWEAF